MSRLALLLALATPVSQSLLARQRVTALPGVPDLSPYEYYSGFLDAGSPPSGRGTMFFHYICAMAPEWKKKPLMLWYNGGPGAPSTYGLFQEFGPFLLSAASFDEDYRRTGVPTPKRNPWTWANVTSICEIDSPAPIGASFCSEGNGSEGSEGGPSGDAYACGPWSDLTVAAANHQAHIAFFRDAFPEFVQLRTPIVIAGESYAGIYIPYFIKAWLEDPVPGVNLVGFAIGDGCTACIPMPNRTVNWCIDLNNNGFEYPNSLPGPYWDLQFFWGHSQISTSLYKEISASCTMDELLGITMPADWSAKCKDLVYNHLPEETGWWYAYNLFEACPDEVSEAGRGARRSRRAQRLSHRRLRPSEDVTFGDGDTGLGAPCLVDSLGVYFGHQNVQTALGIPLNNNFVDLDNGIGMNYTIDAPFVGEVYERAVKQGLRILVYEGDSDASGLQTNPMEDVWVPFFGNGTGMWTPAGRLDGSIARPLGLPLTQPWRPFGVLPAGRKVQGGYVMEWAGGQVQFASIRGAGHLAPLYRPAAALTVMSAWLGETPLPPGLRPPERSRAKRSDVRRDHAESHEWVV
eukprot:TRINITY_DN30329_c0_g1_i1.p1 TRINITY_DN30329_c0_g1~~TRINITY_DN30329_c0_g1_i1.p1  ORF type:complete len:587 (-),score=97.24 TRINITY_DN30329_c0_g1_i1:134-1858(-)